MADGPGGGYQVRAELTGMRTLASTVNEMSNRPPWMGDNLGAAYKASNFAESGMMKDAITSMSQALADYQTDYSDALRHNGNFLNQAADNFDRLDQQGADDFHRANFRNLDSQARVGDNDLNHRLDGLNQSLTEPATPRTPLRATLPSDIPDLAAPEDRDWRPETD